MNKYIVKALSGYKFDFEKYYGYGIINDYEVNVYNNPIDVGPIFFISTYLSEDKKNEFVSKLNQKKLIFVSGYAFEYGVAVQIGAFTSMGFEKKFRKVFPIVLDILSELGALKDNACPQTGIEFDDYARLVDISQYQIKVKLSLDGIKSINENIDKSNENYNNQPNNYLRGFCGLLIGGIVGAVVAFILDLLGVISTVSPAIAIILGVYLYKKFGGKPNVVMILMSIFVTIVCIFLPSFIGYISIANELCSKGEKILSGFEAFSYCLSTNSEFSRLFKAELLYNIVFTLLAVVWCAIPLFKSLKRPRNLK